MSRAKKPEDEHYVKVGLSFAPEDYDKMLDYCQREERSFSWFVRKAIREYFENHNI